MSHKLLSVIPDNAGQRLDVWLVSQLGNSRNHWQELIKRGAVRLNNLPVKSSYLVEADDVVSVAEVEMIPESQPATPSVKIVFEDQYLLVAEKPAGLLTHPVAGQKRQATLAQFAAAHSDDQASGRFGIVHRLDRETSGLIIIAKDEGTKDFLQQQFRLRKVHKTYKLLVEGHLKQPEALVDLPIGRKSDSVQHTVIPSGKPAETVYKVLAEYLQYSLVEAYPKTGRTHQLRVHFKHLGHPIVGDRVYGHQPPVGLSRMFLHASDLEFTGPDGWRHKLHSELPAELERFLISLQ